MSDAHTLKVSAKTYSELLDDFADAWGRKNFVIYSDTMRQVFRRILRQGIDDLSARQAMRPLGVPQEL